LFDDVTYECDLKDLSFVFIELAKFKKTKVDMSHEANNGKSAYQQNTDLFELFEKPEVECRINARPLDKMYL
jgi:hypothetical protein